MSLMTKLLEQAIVVARGLPEGAQDEIARLILRAAHEEAGAIALSPEEEASFDESIAQEQDGQFVSEDEVLAFWAKARG
jgi:hypothetical protein